MPRRKFQSGGLVWKKASAGFIGLAGWGVLQPGKSSWPCIICGNSDCVEWDTIFMVKGKTREQAEQNASNGLYIGMACHVGECEMSKEKTNA